MVTKLICQLPDYDALDIPSKQPVKATQRSCPIQLRSAAVNEISSTETGFNPFNIAQFSQNNSVLTWVNN